MKKISFVPLAVSAVILTVALVGLAQADLITCNVDASLADGGTITGSFVYDTGTASETQQSFTVTAASSSLAAVAAAASAVGLTVANPATLVYSAQESETVGLNPAYWVVEVRSSSSTYGGPPFYLLTTQLVLYTPRGISGPLLGGQYLVHLFNIPTTGTNWLQIASAELNVTGGEMTTSNTVPFPPPSAVPLPPTVLLLGSGLLGLAGWRRLRKG